MAKRFTHSPVAALAYALFDAEGTARLGEQPDHVVAEYFDRARELLEAIKGLRTSKERKAIIRAIR